jgi:predicted CopG family antitoxin
MAEKTVKVDEAVHQRLEELKQSYGVETFNEVLRHELDIISGADIDTLAAFLHDDLKQLVREIAETIREIGQLEERVKEERRREILEFFTPDSNTVIASIKFDEKSFQVEYRGQDGEMKSCGRGWYSSSSEKPKYGRRSDISDNTEAKDVLEQVETKVSGSYGRWAS